MSDAQVPVAIDSDNLPEFYGRCCTDLSKIGATPTRIDGMRAILTRANLMWENGRTITVGFVAPAAGTTVQQNKVKEVVKEWEKVANLKFNFIPVGRDATIRVSFQRNAGSWSYVGKGTLSIRKPQPTLNLGWVFSGATTTDEEKGVILHEFGHAIGYLHEHQSPRRGEKITLNEEVIFEYTARTQVPPWSEDQTRHNIINVYNVQEVSNFSEVDTTSIMMYFMPAEWNVQHLEIKPNHDLSPLDKAFAFLNYPFIGEITSSDASVCLAGALTTVGITGEFKDSIEAEYAAGDWEGVRAEFTRWSINEKAIADGAKAAAEREGAASGEAAA